MDKFNVRQIIVDHIRTLQDFQTCRYSISDFLVFFGLPIVTTGILVWFYGILRPTLVSIVATSVSIFAALLFNLLLLMYDAMRKSSDSSGNNDVLRRRFLRELSSNISFAILVAIGTITSLLILVLVEHNCVAEYVFSGLIYYLGTVFLITLLMVLKRVHILLRHEGGSA